MKSKSKRWRTAGAAVAATAVGAASGYTASSCGVDLSTACDLGWSAALAAGRSLLPLLRGQEDHQDTGPVEGPAMSDGAVRPSLPRYQPQWGRPEFPASRHTEHRRLRRAAVRSAERIRQHHEEANRGAA